MPIYGAVDILTNSASVNDYNVNGNEAYVNLFSLLTRAAIDGHVTRIAYFSGSAASGSAGNGTGFWDTPNAAGGNSWSVWRFNSSSYRDYEFYMMINYAPIVTLFGTEPSQSFKLGSSTTVYSVVGLQLAAAFDPETGATTNPWNGTTNNDGSDTVTCVPGVAGASIWTTGSAGYSLSVLPYANATSNATDVFETKGMFTPFSEGNGTASTRTHLNFLLAAGTDSDGLLCVYKNNSANAAWEFNYAGVWKPRPELTGSAKVPLILTGGDEMSGDFAATSISTTTHNSRSCGMTLSLIAKSERTTDYSLVDVNTWQKIGSLPANTLLGTVATLEEASLGLSFSNENGRGYLGTYPELLVKCITGTQVEDLAPNENKIAFGVNTTPTNFKLVTAWSSSVGGLPGTNDHRTGSIF